MAVKTTRIHRFITTLTVLACSPLMAPQALAGPDYDTALNYYKQKQYEKAAVHFETASLRAPGNISANYYAAYCFHLVGKRQEAIQSYRRLCKNFPGTREAQQAQRALSAIDPQYKDGQAGNPAAESGNTGNLNVGGRKKETAESLTNRLVKVQKATGKLADVTGDFVKSIKDMVAAIPLPILILMDERGGEFDIAPSVVEHDLRIQNTAPRGWGSDSSWKESPAVCSGTKVIIAQYKLNSSTGEYVTTETEIGVVRHETGHAIDHCLNGFSTRESFRHAYYLDEARVPDELRSRMAYYLQKSTSGPSEVFAELICSRLGGETDNYRKESGDLVYKHFPLCRKEMENLLAELGVK
ncbi:MAG TPA: hypothetical protein PLF23_07505 [Candidatus Obscuribacter sp.]|nr:hypothetical protein [Candidatus Obscuribacter sp.]